MLLGHLCNHVPSIQLRQEVHVVQNQCTQPDTRIQLECRSFIKTSTNRASPQKMHFTAWCFVSDIEFTCLHQLPLLRQRLFSGASSQLCLNWTCYISACRSCGIVHCWRSMLLQSHCFHLISLTEKIWGAIQGH